VLRVEFWHGIVYDVFMKLVIIGSKGMLGQYLLSVFSHQDRYDVFGLDKTEIDITQKEDVIQVLSKIRPDMVINAAAYNNVDQCEEDDGYRIALAVNGDGVKNLSEACRLIDATLVHYSTDYVFDGENQIGYVEDDKTNPVSQYGMSKLAGERALLSANLPKYYLIRTSRLFGKCGVSEEVKKSFVDLMLDLNKKVSTINGINEEISNPTYAQDLAQATKKLIEGKHAFGIYHITNSGGCTWHDLATEIFKIKNIDVKVVPVTRDFFGGLAKRPKSSMLINTKLSQLRTWQEALGEYLKD